MEKIKLVNGQIFEIIPVGIVTKDYEKIRMFSFISTLGYGEIENAFSNVSNIQTIEYYSATDEILKTYTDCISLKSITKEFNREIEEGKYSDVYSVILVIE